VKFPAYTAYKSSGIELIGKIPTHWNVKRLKFISSEITVGIVIEPSKYYEDAGIACLRSLNVKPNNLTENDLVYISNESNEILKKSKLCQGDLVVVRTGQPGTTAVVSERYNGANCIDLIIIRKPKNASEHFISYFLNSLPVQAQFSVGTGGAIQQHFNISVATDLLLVLPSLHEQYDIADYLNTETKKIDRLLTKKRELVEKLKEKRSALISRTLTRGLPPEAARAAGLNPHPKLKPSGIEWLSDIPEHWLVSSIKYEAIVISKGTTPSTIGKEMVNEGIRFLKAENIQNACIQHAPEFFIDLETDKLLSRSRLRNGDVLIVIAGATTGKAAILDEKFLPANINQAVCFIRLKKKVYPKILCFWLNTPFIQELIWNKAVQSAQPNLAMEDIKSFPCLVPPMLEQYALIEYLTFETTKIDQLVKNVELAIERLQEYRAALITAAVTGKIDVNQKVTTSENILGV
jgi:type I restriction enzyme, S subunit